VSDVYDAAHVAAPVKAKSRKKKVIVISAVVGVLAAPGLAWAAVELFGFGSFNSAATTAQNLTIVGDPTTTKPLAPGQTVGVKGIVKNTNDFPVTVNRLIVKNSSAVTTPNDPASCKISFVGGAAATYPAKGAAPSAPGTGFEVSPPVTIAPGDQVWVQVDNIIKQDASATKLCAISADYAVRGIVGSE
jgi:hypothetical protein